MDWKAAYGLLLIQLTKEADELERQTGEFVEVEYPTEEEFRAMRKYFKQPKFGRQAVRMPTTLHVRGWIW